MAIYSEAIRSPDRGGSMDSSYVVGWGTLALINANLAQCKDRPGWVWFLGRVHSSQM